MPSEALQGTRLVAWSDGIYQISTYRTKILHSTDNRRYNSQWKHTHTHTQDINYS